MNTNPGEEVNRMADGMSREDVGDTLGKESKAEKMAKEKSVLRQYWKDIKTSFALLRDWYMGTYTAIPFRLVASLAAALLYMVSPLDIVPDWIPLGGLLDDAIVLAAVFTMSRKDLETYAEWQKRDNNGRR